MSGTLAANSTDTVSRPWETTFSPPVSTGGYSPAKDGDNAGGGSSVPIEYILIPCVAVGIPLALFLCCVVKSWLCNLNLCRDKEELHRERFRTKYKRKVCDKTLVIQEATAMSSASTVTSHVSSSHL